MCFVQFLKRKTKLNKITQNLFHYQCYYYITTDFGGEFQADAHSCWL